MRGQDRKDGSGFRIQRRGAGDWAGGTNTDTSTPAVAMHARVTQTAAVKRLRVIFCLHDATSSLERMYAPPCRTRVGSVRGYVARNNGTFRSLEAWRAGAQVPTWLRCVPFALAGLMVKASCDGGAQQVPDDIINAARSKVAAALLARASDLPTLEDPRISFSTNNETNSGGRLAVMFNLPAEADASQLVVAAAGQLSNLAKPATMSLRGWEEPGVSRALALTSEKTLSMTLFVPLIANSPSQLEFHKIVDAKGGTVPLTDDEAKALAAIVASAFGEAKALAWGDPFHHLKRAPSRRRRRDADDLVGDSARRGRSDDAGKANLVASLERLGATVTDTSAMRDDKGADDDDNKIWCGIAGYQTQKQDVEETLLLPMTHPELFAAVRRSARGDRVAGGGGTTGTNAPRAVLFAGPPGTGKTTMARAVSRQAHVPMIYLPMESLSSKYYGESEKRLSEALRTAEALGRRCGGALVFLDEIDSVAGRRGSGGGGEDNGGSEMHEATRRSLGVLLRHLDGFGDQSDGGGGSSSADGLPPAGERKWSTLVAATNRPQDLDEALMSRFAGVVTFPLPDIEGRTAIFDTYATSLTMAEKIALARRCESCSGRDVKDACEAAERKWAAQLARKGGKSASASPPPMRMYEMAVEARAARNF